MPSPSLESQAPASAGSAASHGPRPQSGVLDRMVALLPPPLCRLPRELVGFALLGLVTFGIDLALLATLREATALPLWLCVTLAYTVAFGMNFLANRRWNFHAHGPIGQQAMKYGLVVGVDYSITVLGTTGLVALGVYYGLARVLAGAAVASVTYTAARFWVFPRTICEDPGRLS